jgi:hypothetical protein
VTCILPKIIANLTDASLEASDFVTRKIRRFPMIELIHECTTRMAPLPTVTCYRRGRRVSFMREFPVSGSDGVLQRRSRLPVADDFGKTKVALILHAGVPPQGGVLRLARLS